VGHRYYGHLFERKIEFYRSGQGISSIADFLKRKKKENDNIAKLIGGFDEDHDFDIDEVDFEEEDDSY
jgi:hypothetical protein